MRVSTQDPAAIEALQLMIHVLAVGERAEGEAEHDSQNQLEEQSIRLG